MDITKVHPLSCALHATTVVPPAGAPTPSAPRAQRRTLGTSPPLATTASVRLDTTTQGWSSVPYAIPLASPATAP